MFHKLKIDSFAQKLMFIVFFNSNTNVFFINFQYLCNYSEYANIEIGKKISESWPNFHIAKIEFTFSNHHKVFRSAYTCNIIWSPYKSLSIYPIIIAYKLGMPETEAQTEVCPTVSQKATMKETWCQPISLVYRLSVWENLKILKCIIFETYW